MSFSASGSISLSLKKWAAQGLAPTCCEGRPARTHWVWELSPGHSWVPWYLLWPKGGAESWEKPLPALPPVLGTL